MAAMGENRNRHEALREVFESYGLHSQALEGFFRDFTDPNHPKGGAHGQHKYLNALQDIADGDSSTLNVDFDDLKKFFGNEKTQSAKTEGLLEGVMYNARRYVDLMFAAAEKVKQESTPSTSPSAGWAQASAAKMEQAQVPVNVRAPFDIRISSPSNAEPLAVRDVKAQHVGSLVLIDAVVARVSPVKPRIQVATYKCTDCGSDVFQAVDGPQYMPLSECNSKSCVRNKAKGELQLRIRESKFVKHQEVKIQEPSHGVPPGSIPRTMKIVVEGGLTRKLTPGMAATLGGILLPVVKSGFNAMRSGLVAEKYFEVHSIEVHKKGYNEAFSISPAQSESVERSLSSPNLYQKLADSIAPSICGHDDVKKALLLQLVGGVTENFPDGMKIRGDIHVLLMGDPGVAKSQMLRQICKIAPRAHYTTGKGSSGVGLTASVAKDPVTGEFTLEGGAIVLADNGICCIDEFDKMDESDRTAIHEVMEQQTVSIAKAGLATTLNARTCILAAANPVYGRYDVKKSPVANMNLPPALLSRFDVQFLLLDRPDADKDFELAKHVLETHRRGTSAAAQAQNAESYFDAHIMRYIISKARKFSPKIHQNLIAEIAEHYVELRSRERMERDRNEFRGYTTPRTLLAVLRLSQALARLRRSDIVDRSDFDEALRLMQTSKDSVIENSEMGKSGRRDASDFRSDIISLLKDIDSRNSKRSDWSGYMMYTSEILEAVIRQGLNENQLKLTIEEYIELDVLQWKNEEHRALAFTDRLETISG